MNRTIVLLLLFASSVLFVGNNTYAQEADYCVNVPVIYYHHIQSEREAYKKNQTSLTVDTSFFESHMKYLAEHGYTSMSISQFISDFLARKPLHPKPVVITIDDGYKDALTNAFPIAKKYGMIVNLMIPTGLLENQDYLSWNNLKELVHSKLVFAYNHTWSHYSLDRGGYEKIRSEVTTAQNALSEQLGSADTIIAYPYGGYNATVIKTIQKLGYRAAFSTNSGHIACFSNILSLPRIRIGNALLSTYGL